MKKVYSLLMITIFFLMETNSQNSDYWVNAQPGTTKVFTISFTDELNGKATSGEGDVLITQDGGESWKLNQFQGIAITSEEYIWKADIYCAIMKTTDSGLTWFAYDKEKQEHFCCVYLKDKNTGYNIASNFLSKVTSKIFLCYKNDELHLLIEHPQQCTEYYSSIDEGWALGWCVKDFQSLKK